MTIKGHFKILNVERICSSFTFDHMVAFTARTPTDFNIYIKN